MNKQITETDLAQFTGTTQWYKHPLGVIYTDGIKYLAEKAGAYWLLDIVASYQPKHKDKPFQLWNLQVNKKDNSAVIIMKEDSNQPILVKQEIPYTDFPLEEMEFYCIDGTLLLKGEY